MGRQSGKTYRTTISIPLDLKARMDAAGEQVNWSAVAARAFEEKLAELASRKSAKERTMADVVQRLRASKLKGQDRRYKAGHDAGERWAKNLASAEELERLADFLDTLDCDPSYGREEFFSDYGLGAHSKPELLYFKLDPEEE